VVVVDYDPAWPATFARLRERVVEALGPLALAVEHVGSPAWPPSRSAITTPAGLPAHHLYVCAAGSEPLARHLAFRDALRADGRTADAYADLKRSLAARLGHDRVAYTEAKSAFIERVLEARR
jgi:GrpB-like predicted nucleotidyltransferase (UPF0157 family)